MRSRKVPIAGRVPGGTYLRRAAGKSRLSAFIVIYQGFFESAFGNFRFLGKFAAGLEKDDQVGRRAGKGHDPRIERLGRKAKRGCHRKRTRV